MKTKKQEYPTAATNGLHAAALIIIAAGLLLPVTARAAELIDTFDTGINPAVWLNRSSNEDPHPTATVEGGRVVVGAGTIKTASLLSVDSYRLDQDFTLSIDVTAQPLSPYYESYMSISLGVGTVSAASLVLSAALNSAVTQQSYSIGFGSSRPLDFTYFGDSSASIGPVEDNWPQETNHLQLDWDTESGLLTGSYDGVGGRMTFPSISLYDAGYSASTQFQIVFGMQLSTLAFAENRTGTSFDNLSFQQVPEPSALWLGVVAGLGLLGHRRRDRGGEGAGR